MTDSNKDGRNVAGIVGGGPINYGQSIRFVFEFSDKSREPFHCDYAAMPKIVQVLTQLAAVTENAVRSQGKPSLDTVNPFRAKSVQVGTATQQKNYVIRFQTVEGLPVEIAMNADLARELISKLEGELRRGPIALDS